MDYQTLADNIKIWAYELGFEKVGICDIDLKTHEAELLRWLQAGYHGEMKWMARHGTLRARPHELLPGTIRVISARMNYLPPEAQFASTVNTPAHADISRYALGRDYHKILRKQLKKLGEKIKQETKQLNYRPFVDSAPILERPLAQKAGLGWTGKHSLILDQQAGSWFFLGEILVDIPLPVDQPSQNQCGNCRACMTTCPTNAIVSEGVVDARRCISYLTIEYSGIIPEEFRTAIGNRIYGCDDCQLVCPWNRFSEITNQPDFHRRNIFTIPDLIELFSWEQETFQQNLEGSAIRRIGHQQWLRNIAVAMGNAPYSERITHALKQRLGYTELLDIHIHWALKQQQKKALPKNRKHERLIRIVQKGLPRDS
jgi:epoxyqueuosine reductase